MKIIHPKKREIYETGKREETKLGIELSPEEYWDQLSLSERLARRLEVGSLSAWRVDFEQKTDELKKRESEIESELKELEWVAPYYEQISNLIKETEEEIYKHEEKLSALEKEEKTEDIKKKKIELQLLRNRRKQAYIVIGEWQFRGRGMFQIDDPRLKGILGLTKEGPQAGATPESARLGILEQQVSPYREKLEKLKARVQKKLDDAMRELEQRRNFLTKLELSTEQGEVSEEGKISAEREITKLEEKIAGYEIDLRRIRDLHPEHIAIKALLDKANRGELPTFKRRLKLRGKKWVEKEEGKTKRGFDLRAAIRELESRKEEIKGAQPTVSRNIPAAEQFQQYQNLRNQLTIASEQCALNEHAQKELDNLISMLPPENPEEIDKEIIEQLRAQREKKKTAKEITIDKKPKAGKPLKAIEKESQLPSVSKPTVGRERGVSIQETMMQKLLDDFREIQRTLKEKVDRAAEEVEALEQRYRARFAQVPLEALGKELEAKKATLVRAEKTLAEFEAKKPKEQKPEEKLKKAKGRQREEAKEVKQEKRKAKEAKMPYDEKSENLRQSVRDLKKELEDLETLYKVQLEGGMAPSAEEEEKTIEEKLALMDQIHQKKEVVQEAEKNLKVFYQGESMTPETIRFYRKLQLAEDTGFELETIGTGFKEMATRSRIFGALREVDKERKQVLSELYEREEKVHPYIERIQELEKQTHALKVEMEKEPEGLGERIEALSTLLKDIEENNPQSEPLLVIYEEAHKAGIALQHELERIKELNQEFEKIEDRELQLKQGLRKFKEKISTRVQEKIQHTEGGAQPVPPERVEAQQPTPPKPSKPIPGTLRIRR